MTDPENSSNIPAALQASHDAANAAWDAEREAWSPMSMKPSASHEQVDAWWRARGQALAAQAKFDEDVANWRKANGLD
jgi:predicted transposase YbfD/YdcC